MNKLSGNQLRIIEDQTVDYGNGDQLFVMIIKEYDRYLLQIDTRTVHVGRRFVRDLKVADIVITQTVKSLSAYTDIYSAFNVLDFAFTLNSLKAFMFWVSVRVNNYTLNEIFQMRKIYSYQVQTNWCDDNELEPLKANAVQVFFDGYTEPLGVFKPCDKTDKFEFEVNELFVLTNLKC